jgi:hypothetical protein
LFVCVLGLFPAQRLMRFITLEIHAEGASRRPRRTYFFFGEAFFEAFNGSSVVLPANPRRSLGGAFAFDTNT